MKNSEKEYYFSTGTAQIESCQVNNDGIRARSRHIGEIINVVNILHTLNILDILNFLSILNIILNIVTILDQEET